MPRPTANWFAWVADFSFVAVVLAPLVGIGSLNAREQHVFVESGRPLAVTGSATDDMRQVDGALVLSGADNALFADLTLDQGDFRIQARLALPELAGSGASLLLEGNLVYSNDHGQTWKLGGIAAPGTPESTVVELVDGAVMLNMRRGPRSVAISQDGGETFPTTKRDPALPGPDCQATLCRYSWPDDANRGGKSRILFCNPATQARGENGRRGMTVRLSYDEGESWPIERLVYAGYSAYSAMTVLPDGRIAILYEKDGYRRLSFAAFTLDWLTRGKESLDK